MATVKFGLIGFVGEPAPLASLGSLNTAKPHQFIYRFAIAVTTLVVFVLLIFFLERLKKTMMIADKKGDRRLENTMEHIRNHILDEEEN